KVVEPTISVKRTVAGRLNRVSMISSSSFLFLSMSSSSVGLSFSLMVALLDRQPDRACKMTGFEKLQSIVSGFNSLKNRRALAGEIGGLFATTGHETHANSLANRSVFGLNGHRD